MTTKAQIAEQAEAIAKLREWIKPGDTVHTILRHVSTSGMSRSISLVHMGGDGREPIGDFTYLAARAMGDKIDQKNGGIKVGGGGMDMGFALVYALSYRLYRDDFTCIGDGCPANDHSNPPHPARIAGSMQHSDAGYALRQRWL